MTIEKKQAAANLNMIFNQSSKLVNDEYVIEAHDLVK